MEALSTWIEMVNFPVVLFMAMGIVTAVLEPLVKSLPPRSTLQIFIKKILSFGKTYNKDEGKDVASWFDYFMVPKR